MRYSPETLAFHANAVDRVIAALRAPEPEVRTLDEMAELACLSPFHFCRVFRRLVGISPAAFFAALRLDRAKRLLLETDASVTEICHSLDYDSLGTFTTRFGEHVGVSPGRFRRLPEMTAAALDVLHEQETHSPRWSNIAPVVRGQVIGPPEAAGPTFVGLFPVAMARGKPVAGTAIPRTGQFTIPMPLDGCYSLLAVSLPSGCDPLAALAPGVSSLVGSAGSPLVVKQGVAQGPTEVALRPFLPIDPPVLVALPPLLFPEAGLQRKKGKIEEVFPWNAA